MANVSPRALFEKLNTTTRRALEAAAGLCLSRTHFHVEIEHWLVKLLESTSNDLGFVLHHYGADPSRVRRELEQALNQFKPGNSRPPDLSLEILDLVREAWVLASLEYRAQRIRSGHLLAALLGERMLSMRARASAPELAKVPVERLTKEVRELLAASPSEETDEEPAASPAAAPNGTSAAATSSRTPSLDQFTINLTERARKGEIDPVIGRDAEIRQVIDILTRRRQNNPILTGEAGVGKTAVVEGLALRIVAGDVPEALKNVVLRILDLGLLQAGAGVKGEFENRLKSVIAEVKASPQPVILFIDEAHTIIGAGGQQGQGDAANLLKPALARRELRTIAATTYAEYKKYFATDAALTRRFQVVRVEEPDEAKAVRMLRGLVPMLEKHHGVRVLDEALAEAVRLTTRYVPERQLPDKAVSLLDKVCARVALSQSATPPALEDARREAEHLAAEIKYVERDAAGGGDHADRHKELKDRLAAVEANRAALESQLERERKLAVKVREMRQALEQPAEGGPPPDGLRAELAQAQAE